MMAPTNSIDLTKQKFGRNEMMFKWFRQMNPKPGFLRRQWRKVKGELTTSLISQYRRCVIRMKRCLHENNDVEQQRRKSQAKLHPLPDRPLRRAASKLSRKPTNEIERLRKKGDDWNANDLFKFQYSDPEEGTPEERKQLCYDWLDRLHDISKKYCYLAWYESAIYACYYRLAPILVDPVEKQRIWHDVKHEYAEIFMMGRRIWRRAIHPSRLRVFYDLAMLCVRFGDMEKDDTVPKFKELMSDSTNFDFKILNETEFIKSLDKVIKLENFVIDQFYKRRRSSGSIRSSFRSRRNTDCSPSRRSELLDSKTEDDADDICSLAESLQQVSVSLPATTVVDNKPTVTLSIPTIVIDGPDSGSPRSRPPSPRLVRFDE
ncbi:hypothetical protein GCK72_016161 [Caenorhabditis remanei]|uniref:DUF7758 domain-containing protein n=1 Tax=Caenorhabditis remanei TaxID=31234 RepID=A0A6A5GYT8_CAERE|nr:hypothetical protein GCK72_016161 [Caenorhabditis remanei]KAF1759694.1 hypothetical protein GCK72_016161 [Caenorhabditis remanei]